MGATSKIRSDCHLGKSATVSVGSVCVPEACWQVSGRRGVGMEL